VASQPVWPANPLGTLYAIDIETSRIYSTTRGRSYSSYNYRTTSRLDRGV